MKTVGDEARHIESATARRSRSPPPERFFQGTGPEFAPDPGAA
jgi:hypothetical protein